MSHSFFSQKLPYGLLLNAKVLPVLKEQATLTKRLIFRLMYLIIRHLPPPRKYRAKEIKPQSTRRNAKSLHSPQGGKQVRGISTAECLERRKPRREPPKEPFPMPRASSQGVLWTFGEGIPSGWTFGRTRPSTHKHLNTQTHKHILN